MKYFVLFSFAIVFGISACGGDAQHEAKDSVAACNANSLNPNGDSELALLMREMAAFTDSAKQDLLNGREIAAKPDHIRNILSAKKTDESIDKAIFTPLAQNYLGRVEDFYGAKPEQKTEAFNNMVKACISCHENFCGGPIKRIQKLFIPAK